MHPKWTARGIVAATTLLAVLLGWALTRPPARVGDVPYVATPIPVVDRMLELAGVGPGDLVLDLGSGDGRIVLRAAKWYGARARGIEIDADLVRRSRAAAVAAGVAERTEFVEADLFEAELRDATAVTMFLLPTVNLRLRPRLLADLAPGTPIVSHMWDMGEWRPDASTVVPGEPSADLHRWIVPDGFAGVWDVTGAGGQAGGGPTTGVEPSDVDAGSFLDGGVLRLMQRFQQIEGELLSGGHRVPVQGVVNGRRARVTTTRPHPRLGDVVFEGTRAGRHWQGTLDAARLASGPASADFRATLRDVVLEGDWEVSVTSSTRSRQWTMRWRHDGGAWTATRRLVDTHDSNPTASDRLPSEDSSRPSGDDPRGQKLDEAYVWGGGVAFRLPESTGSSFPGLYYGWIENDHMVGVGQEGGTLVPWFAERRSR